MPILLKVGNKQASVKDHPLIAVSNLIINDKIPSAKIYGKKIKIPGFPKIEIVWEPKISGKVKVFDKTIDAIEWLRDSQNKTHNIGSIEIKVQPIIPDSGIKSWKILDITGVLTGSELPDEYKQGGGYMYWYLNDRILFIWGSKNHLSIGDALYINGLYSDEEFQEALEFIRSCGERLAKINKRIRAERREWEAQGVKTIKI